MREKRLFFEAIEIADPAGRERFLSEACQDNPELRKRIDALLLAAEGIGNFLVPESSVDRSPAQKKRPGAANSAQDRPEQPAVSLDFLAPPASPEFIGKLKHYDIISLLGHGAFGIVLKAFDRRLHRQVAIKVLAPHLATTSPPRKRFLREARSCAAIRHPNVVHLYDVADAPCPFIAMELIAGQTLQDRIDDAGPLEISEVIEIAQQLTSGLEAAHAAGLIHRDIKPSNILIEHHLKLRAVLTDFGLARAVDDASLTQSGVLTGTPNFMSPEQSRGDALDYRTDLFSLGSVLYVMITGRLPFRSRSTIGVLQRVAQHDARPIAELTPDCPRWLAELVERLHEKSPDRRIQTATETREILETHREKKTVLTPTARPSLPAATGPRARQEPQRPDRNLFLGVGFAGFSIAALLTAFLFFREQEAADPSIQSGVSAAESIVADALAQPLVNSQANGDTTPAAHWRQLPPHAPAPAIAPFDREAATRHQQQWAEYLGVPVEFTDQLGITFRLIPPGEFVMGTSDQEIQAKLHHVQHDPFWKSCLLSEAPRHRVALTQPFYLATTEVTQHQFESIMSLNPSHFSTGGERRDLISAMPTYHFPVEGVTWQQTQTFLRRLNGRLGYSPKSAAEAFYRLPTEAEWEFACRGGTQTTYWTGETVESLVENENHNELLGRMAEVASFRPNPFGLYDMSGNVNEYVQDRWDSRYEIATEGPVTVDPVGPGSVELTTRVARGGDYWWWAYHCRSAYRIFVEEEERSGFTIGFRLAVNVDTYKTLSPALTPEKPVTDFSEIHGATLTQFQAWLDSLRGQFVPSRVNVRHGTEEVVLDGVAIDKVAADETEPGTWAVHFFENDREAGRDFATMRHTHNIYWKLLFPSPETRPLAGPGLKIWRQSKRDAGTWNVLEGDLQQAVDQSKLKGWLPMSLAYTESGGGKNSAYVQHFLPGVGNQSLLGLTPAQFQEQTAQFRARNWRLHFFQFQVGTAVPKISCVFRDNLDKVAWEMSYEQTQPQYEQELQRRRQSGWYPSCVGSYQENGITKYVVAWERLSQPAEANPGNHTPGTKDETNQ